MVRDLDDLDLTWLEEPVWPPGDHDGLSRVRLEGRHPHRCRRERCRPAWISAQRSRRGHRTSPNQA